MLSGLRGAKDPMAAAPVTVGVTTAFPVPGTAIFISILAGRGLVPSALGSGEQRRDFAEAFGGLEYRIVGGEIFHINGLAFLGLFLRCGVGSWSWSCRDLVPPR